MAPPIPLDQLPVYDRNQVPFPSENSFREGAVIPFDKPEGWSSFDVVRFVRNRIPIRKVGHAGTLDPMATGMLVLCCGKATRSVSQIQEKPKTYIAELTFGGNTPSYDATTAVSETSSWQHITKNTLVDAIEREFIGEYKQIPPVYSALWKNGQRMYKLARKGVEIQPDPRKVRVYDIELLSFDLPKVILSVRSGKGFYVRSLAYDLAKSVGSLAYLSGLRRTAVGTFSVDDAWTSENFNQWCEYG